MAWTIRFSKQLATVKQLIAERKATEYDDTPRIEMLDL